MPVGLGRGEEALVARPAEIDPAEHLVDRRHAPHVALGKVGLAQRMPQRHALGGRALLRLDAAARHLHLAHRRERLAAAAIEDVDIALLRRQDQRGRALIVDQGGLGAEIIVPHVIAHCLEAPSGLAGGHIERQQRSRVELLLRPAQRRIIVRRGIAHREIDEPELLVAARHRPHVRRAARPFLPGGRRAVPVRMHHVPGPAQLAGDDVEPLDHARRRPAILPVQHLMAGDEHPADERGRRVDRDEAGGNLAHALLGIDLAIRAEIGTGLAALRIDRDQPRIERALDHPRRTGLVRRRIGHGVIDHAAARRGIGDRIVRHLWIVAPFLHARRRVEREQDVLGRADVQAVAHLERRVLGAIGLPDHRGGRQVAGMGEPCLLELRHVRRRDLDERRIAPGAGGAAIDGPVGAGLLAGGVDHPRGPRRRQAGKHRIGLAGRGGPEVDHGEQQRHPDTAQRQPPLARRRGERRQHQDHCDGEHYRRDHARHLGPGIGPDFPPGP